MECGRLDLVEYGPDPNTPSLGYIDRTYDEVDRLTLIEHYDALDNLLQRIAYTWNLDNTVYERTEHSPPDDTVTVRFTYDNRKRLIREKRYIPDIVPAVLYELAYTYDQLGNRVTKHDVVNDVQTCYVYDTDYDPATSTWDPNLCFTPGFGGGFYATQNNRLLEYQVRGPESGGNRDLLRTVRYIYTNDGDAVHIVLKDEWTGQGAAPAEYDHYYALRLVYAGGGTLWLAVSENWENGWAPDPADASHTAEYVREFRYDAPRQRYMVRDWDPVNYALPSTWLIDETSWTDYLGVQPYVDYDVTINGSDPVASEAVRFIAALGIHGEKDVVAQGTPETYYHPDLTGSTTVATDETGAQSARTAYTAFGELVDANGVVGYDPLLAPPTRYQYSGAFGYESDLIVLYGANPDLPPITLQHVGARWYQPNIGRFVQRDPIGLLGGLNCYEYCGSEPSSNADPSGLGGAPIRPEITDLPRWPNGYLKPKPPGMKYKYDPVTRKWKLVPRTPPPGKLPWWKRLWNKLRGKKPPGPGGLIGGAATAGCVVGLIAADLFAPTHERLISGAHRWRGRQGGFTPEESDELWGL